MEEKGSNQVWGYVSRRKCTEVNQSIKATLNRPVAAISLGNRVAGLPDPTREAKFREAALDDAPPSLHVWVLQATPAGRRESLSADSGV